MRNRARSESCSRLAQLKRKWRRATYSPMRQARTEAHSAALTQTGREGRARGEMGCVHSSAVADASWPNLFQRNLCLHHKVPASEVYTIVGELGKGAFGIVEKVVHNQTKKRFAMKTVTFASSSKRHEFEKEIDILRGLHHPNIVRMVETFEDDHHFYIIMELCTGGTLLDKVKACGELCCGHPEDSVRVVITKLASVIQYLHSCFICHRDLKLENILIESQELGGCIKLCEYVFTLHFGASTLFRMGMHMRKVLGSVVYMAPEVLEENYTHATDLVHLEICPILADIFYVCDAPPQFTLLSNTPPFHGSTEDELTESTFEAKVVFEGPVWDGVSADAKSLIKKLLNPDPASRYLATQVLKHPWIKSSDKSVAPEVLDQQHEKGVNLLEFVAATLNTDDVSNEETLRTAFRIFDRKNTGGITHQNLMTLLGQHFDAAGCQEMVKRADADKDGKIGFEDFAKMMKLPASVGCSNRRFSRSGSGNSPRASKCGCDLRSSKKDTQEIRHSMTVRSTSSFQLKEKINSAPERRRSSSPSHEMMEAVAAIRAEHDHQEGVAIEMVLVSREEALKKIQALRDDVAHAGSSHHSNPDVGAADVGQVEISLAEPASAPSIQVTA
ncbi:Camk/cdpk protein kinase, partial [Globisporangium splendens]